MESGKNKVVWYAVATLLVVLIGVVAYYMQYSKETAYQDLGTYDDPEVALKETQKALALLSKELNFGMENVLYIEEYEHSKNLIFK